MPFRLNHRSNLRLNDSTPDRRARRNALASRTAARLIHGVRLKPMTAALMALAGLIPSLSHAQLAGAAAQPVPVDEPWGLRLSPQLEEHLLQVGDTPATFTLSDYLTAAGDQNVSLQGHSEIRKDKVVIKGDKIHYDSDTDQADAYGHVLLVNEGNRFLGPEAHLTVDANEGFMLKPYYFFNNTGGSGHADRVNLLDPDRSTFLHSYYTACQCVNPANPANDGKTTKPAWYIQSTTLDLDTGAEVGEAYNAVVFFQGVPIFASPYLRFPLDNDRHTGLLPPTYGSDTSSGIDLITPFYVNIAPDRDLTVYPRYMSKRGEQLSGTYRYLSPTYSGSDTLQYLPDDEILHRNRFAIYLTHNQNLGNGFGAYVNYNRVSDNQYANDLGSTNIFSEGTVNLYDQEAGLTYNNGPWAVLTRVQHFQTLPPSTSPYESEPQINVKYTQYNVDGFDFGAMADATRFVIATAEQYQGQRLVLDPYVSYPINAPGFYVIPKVQAHLAAYDLTTLQTLSTGLPVVQPTNPSVAIPTFSLDLGATFERSVTIFGTDYVQTFEPRLYYVYTPYVDQTDIPIFDTADTDFGIAEVFSPNTFVGEDRVADQSRAVVGLTSRFINAASGEERARFLIAQQYYFKPQTVTLQTTATLATPGTSLTNIDRSDMIVGAQFRYGGGISTESAIQYSDTQNIMEREVYGVAWNGGDHQVINLAYRYNRVNSTLDNQPINQALLSTQWPLTQHLYGVARVDYALGASQLVNGALVTGHRLVDGLVGFQYDADCWSFGLGIQRYSNAPDGVGESASGTRFLAQLVLKGLSHVDNGLVAQFSSAVQGYQGLPGPAPIPSPFSNFP